MMFILSSTSQTEPPEAHAAARKRRAGPARRTIVSTILWEFNRGKRAENRHNPNGAFSPTRD